MTFPFWNAWFGHPASGMQETFREEPQRPLSKKLFVSGLLDAIRSLYLSMIVSADFSTQNVGDELYQWWSRNVQLWRDRSVRDYKYLPAF